MTGLAVMNALKAKHGVTFGRSTFCLFKVGAAEITSGTAFGRMLKRK